MEIHYFLRERIALIQHFFDAASAPFIETKRLIAEAKAPFDNPPWDDSGEPPYLAEWLQADVEQQIVGCTCVSMLSEALKQYFVTWEKAIWGSDHPCRRHAPTHFKKSFIQGYLTCLGEAFGFDPAHAPADLAVIEQIVLARNRSQHADLISDYVEHDDDTRARFPRPFFMRDDEPMDDGNGSGFLAPSIHVERKHLVEAIEQVNTLTTWVEDCIAKQMGSRLSP